jgi:hypothetical protein
MASLSQIASDWTSANGFNSTMAGNRFFYAESKAINLFGITSTPYVVLKPSGDGMVNVCDDMYWCNPGGDKSEVPRIFITEKELQYGAWATQLSNLLTQGANVVVAKTVDAFAQLYSAEPTGFYYNFPWLLKSGDSIRNVSNTWKSFEGLGSLIKGASNTSGGSDMLGMASKIVGTVIGAAADFITPGFGFEETKQYNNTEPQSITITFPLYNTIDLNSAFCHFSFVNLFTFQNLKTRTSLMSYIPPKIYEVDAGSIGGVYMAAAVVTNFKVDSIGTTRRMTEWRSYGAGEILIPEAYKVTITFTDLLSQSSNVFSGAMGGSKIRVTNAYTRDLVNDLNQGVQNLTEGFNDLQKKANDAGFKAGELYQKTTDASYDFGLSTGERILNSISPPAQETPSRGAGAAPIPPTTPENNFPPAPPVNNNPNFLPPPPSSVPPVNNNPSDLPPPPSSSSVSSASFRSNIPARFVSADEPPPMRL